MPYNVDLVGRRLGPVRWTPEPRRILAFAAALAPDDARALDDLAPGFAGPPTMIVTPEWALSLMSRTAPGQTLAPEEASRAVHAGQESAFARPIRPGEAVLSESRVLSARSTRAGAAVTSEIRHVREADGAEIARTWSTSIFRSVALSGADRAIDGADAPPVAPPADGADPAWSVAERGDLLFPRGFAHVYSECADIWNPIHTERRVALAAGLEDIIVHGSALWAIAGLRLGKPGRRLAGLTGRFRAPVVPGRRTVFASTGLGDATAWRIELEDGRVAAEGLARFAAAEA